MDDDRAVLRDTQPAPAIEEVDRQRAWWLENASEHDRNQLAGFDPEKQRDVIGWAWKHAQEWLSKVSPVGSLNLPDLLDKRRLEHAIVDRCFTHHQANYDVVLVKQIDQFEDADKYHGTLIEKTKVAQKADLLEANRCVIVSAGLKALDEIRSHGMDLGHICYLGKHTPLRLRVDVVNGEPQYLLMVHAGDLFSSEDSAQGLRNGDLRVCATEDEDGIFRHALQVRDPQSTRENPVYAAPMKYLHPWIPEDL